MIHMSTTRLWEYEGQRSRHQCRWACCSALAAVCMGSLLLMRPDNRFWQTLRDLPVETENGTLRRILQPFVVIGARDPSWVSRLMTVFGGITPSTPLLLSPPTPKNETARRRGGAGLSATDLAYRPTSQVSAEYLRHALVSLPPDTAANFAPLFRRLRRGLPVQIMAIGSSVTGAVGGCTHGLSPNCPNHCGGECYNLARRGQGWLRRFSDWLDVRSPVDQRNSSTGRRSHSAYNGGKGATHFEHYASCLDSYLPRGPVHLFVLEATLPGGAEACRTQLTGRMKAIEYLLETFRAREPRPAVILLRSLCAWDQHARGQACIFDALHGMARQYGAPFVDLRAASFEGDALRRHAQPTFGSSTLYPARVGNFTPRTLLKDDIHPGPKGEAVIADVLAYALLRAQAVARPAASGATRHHSGAGAGAGTGVGDGAPRDATAVATGIGARRRFTYDCFAFEGWQQQSEVATAKKVFVGGLLRPAHVPLSHGWVYTLRGDTVAASANEQAKLKPGLLATRAGAVAEVAVAMQWRAGGSAQPFVVLEYLKAARQMGRVNVSCHLGCSCESEVIDAHSAPLIKRGRSFHAAAQHVAHVLRVQLLPSGRALRAGMKQAWDERAEGAADDVEPEATAEATTCTLRVELLNASSSDGHSFKLVGLQVGEEMRGAGHGAATASHAPSPRLRK